MDVSSEGDDVLLAQERAALALWLLMQGAMTVKQMAGKLNLSRQGAWDLLRRISRVVPIYEDGVLWRVCGQEDPPPAVNQNHTPVWYNE
jgi:hypothetical protein